MMVAFEIMIVLHGLADRPAEVQLAKGHDAVEALRLMEKRRKLKRDKNCREEDNRNAT